MNTNLYYFESLPILELDSSTLLSEKFTDVSSAVLQFLIFPIVLFPPV